MRHSYEARQLDRDASSWEGLNRDSFSWEALVGILLCGRG